MTKATKLQILLIHKELLLSMFVLFSLTLYVYAKIWTNTDQLGQASPQDPPIVTLTLILFFIASACRALLSWRTLKPLVQTYNFYLFLLLALFAVLFYRVTGISTFILGAIAGFALQNEKPHTVILGGGLIALFFYTIHIIGYSCGLINDQLNVNWTRQSSNEETISRLALGFCYPTRAFAFLLPACFAVYYLNKSLLKKALMTLCACYALVVFIFTNTKTSLIILIALLFGPLIEKALQKKRFLSYLAIASYPILYLISLILTLTAGSNWNGIINRLLSWRPGFWLKYINGGINFIGMSDSNRQLQKLSNPLDNYFLSPLISGGVAISIFLIIWNVIFMYLAYKNRNFKLIVIVLIFELYGMSESQIQPIIMVFLPLLFSFVLSKTALDDNDFFRYELQTEDTFNGESSK